MPGFVRMATLDELPPGSAKEVEHDGRIYALFNVDGEISAIDGVCPHQGGPLADGVLDGSCVTCPWHAWRFDVKTGKTPLGPKIKQAVYSVKVEGRDVFVETA
ncbi:MAG: Rieske (2Fe-2S) protein [Isosphaeraceae bacterium]